MTQPLVVPEIQFARRQLVVSLVELDAPWTSVEPIARVLAALEGIGLELVKSSSDLEATWQPYDRAAAASSVWNGGVGRGAITLSSADAMRATVARSTGRNTVTFTLPASEVTRRGLADVEAAIASIVAVLGSFSFGTASAANMVSFPSLLDAPMPPVPWVQTAWLHVIAPEFADRFGGTARLRGAPVIVREGTRGTSWLYAYADPLHYDTVDAITGMRALSQFLAGT